MTCNAILCGTDLSKHSERAVRYASQLAQQMGTELVIVHVVSPDVAEIADSERQLRAVPGPIEVRCEHILRRGDAAEEITKLAHDCHVSQIVIGTRGRRESHGITIGETALRVVDRAPCPVTVVRDEALDA